MPSKGTSTKSADMVKLEPMMKLVLHCVDRVRRFRLGKEVCQLTDCYIMTSDLIPELNCTPHLNMITYIIDDITWICRDQCNVSDCMLVVARF